MIPMQLVRMELIHKKSQHILSLADMEALSKESHSCAFEGLAIQDDGTILLCTKCGEFSYVDSSEYSLSLKVCTP